MDFDDWLEEVDEIAMDRFGQPITRGLATASWRRYHADGLTPQDVLQSLNDA